MAQAARKEPAPSRDLQVEAAAAAVLKDQLVQIFADDQQELDARTISDTIDGETGLFEAIDRVLAQIGQDEAAAEGISAFQKKLSERKSRLEKRGDTLRTMLTNVMDMLGEKKLERPLGTISLKAVPPKLVVVEESEIPAGYWVPSDPTLDRKELTGALKARAEALDLLEEEREAAELSTDDPAYREKLQAILAEHPPIPGAELSNGSATVQIRFG
jgi:hypothetical protein